MKTNLDTLRSEIQEYLESRGIAVFHGFPHSHDAPTVIWDRKAHPDYRDFIEVAHKAGVRLMTLYANEFNADLIDDAEDSLDALPREQRREIEPRLRQIRAYGGFICQIELSFDLAPRVYVLDLKTDWFDTLQEVLEMVDDA